MLIEVLNHWGPKCLIGVLNQFTDGELDRNESQAWEAPRSLSPSTMRNAPAPMRLGCFNSLPCFSGSTKSIIQSYVPSNLSSGSSDAPSPKHPPTKKLPSS